MADHPEVRYCVRCGHGLEERLIFGRRRPVCPACDHVHFFDPKVAAAVFVVQDGKVLLVRRAMTPGQGMWTLPAGFVDAGEDPRLAAARECQEETGLLVEITGLVDVLFGREHPRGASIVIVYRGRIVGGDLSARDPEEADAVGFFGAHEAPPIAFASTRDILDRWRRGEV